MGFFSACTLSFMSKYLHHSCGPKPMTRVDINDNNQYSNNLTSMTTTMKKTTNLPTHPEIQSILSKHKNIVSTPHDIPSSHGVHDHSIPLVLGSLPPNVHPYHHPFSQKNEIDKIVHESLDVGFMCHSTNPYSSLVFMVLKKEGTQSMCPKFCDLNKLTIKDKFLIPIIDYLLDELSCSQYFTKLDLCFGYHQICMKEFDIFNMTFQTHESHYEFLVMPFGLCNAPSMFQSLMNHVFNHFLCYFFLVFFDDILFYSQT
jgi:hypothetical protein